MIQTFRVCLLALGVATPALAADPTRSLDEARVAAGEVMFRQNSPASTYARSLEEHLRADPRRRHRPVRRDAAAIRLLRRAEGVWDRLD